MLDAAKQRDFMPVAVLFDSWHSSLANLKRVRAHGWIFLTRLKANRKADPDRQGYRQVSEVEIDSSGSIVHLERFGAIKVFRIVTKDGDTGHWATNDLAMDELRRLYLAELSWAGQDRTITGFSSRRAASSAARCEPQDRRRTISGRRFGRWCG